MFICLHTYIYTCLCIVITHIYTYIVHTYKLALKSCPGFCELALAPSLGQRGASKRVSCRLNNCLSASSVLVFPWSLSSNVYSTGAYITVQVVIRTALQISHLGNSYLGQLPCAVYSGPHIVGHNRNSCV